MNHNPPFLKKGDAICIIASARKISKEDLQPAINKFESWGLNVILGNNIFKQHNQFAGSEIERISDFQQALNDVNIKAIIIARGGYGTVRIIDQIDFSFFKNNPKWIVGYSDATVLHSHIHRNNGIETMHAIMPINFPKDGSDNNSIITLKKALFGENITYKIGTHPLNIFGDAEGVLVGGNLSILYAMIGSVSDIDTEGKILFIEDLDEYLYHIDRMMMSLKRAGKLKNIAGLIVGGMTEMKDNTEPFGKSVYEIIAETLKEYRYPICFDFPAGHRESNYALILGRKVTLSVKENQTTLVF